MKDEPQGQGRAGEGKSLAQRNRAFLAAVRSSYAGTAAQRYCLEVLCRRAEVYSDPVQVIVTKSQLCADTGLELKTIKKALREFRAAGILWPVSGIEGGRSRAVTYRFRAAGNAVEAPALADDLSEQWQAAYAALRAQDRSRAETWFRYLWLHRVEDRTALLAHEQAFTVSHIAASVPMLDALRAALDATVPGGVDHVRLIRAARG